MTDSTKEFKIANYICISRLDRRDGRKGGGVALYVKSCLKCVVHLADAETAERSWHLLHSDQGLLLIGNMYRPPDATPDVIEDLRHEIGLHVSNCIGVILVGDFNVHHRKWLRHSHSNNAEGYMLHEICQDLGMKQLVREPTRGEYLLDLVISDMPNIDISVLPTLADHKLVLAKIAVHAAASQAIPRHCWMFKQANWNALRCALSRIDWQFLQVDFLDTAAERFVLTILAAARDHIPKKWISDNKSQHAWLNDACRVAIAAKHASEGSVQYETARDHCSDVITAEYKKHVARIHEKIKACPRGSKRWWKLNDELLNRRSKACAIPALKTDTGEWLLAPADKANWFAIVWAQKSTLPPTSDDSFPWSEVEGTLLDFVVLRSRWTFKFLKHLDEDKATGADDLPARILKEVASEIFIPLTLLCRRILEEGRWPTTWKLHRLIPIFKRKSVFDAENYRGVHITTILSKVVERVIGCPLLHMFEAENCFGVHQWAYRKHRSSKDLITLLVCSWIFAFCCGKCVGAFLSDISGAFDRVFTPFLLSKLRSHGMGQKYLRFLTSFLSPRTGKVCVGGAMSEEMHLQDQVFQGTVLGPPLWNVFFNDVVTSILNPCRGKAFADDLNAFQVFDRNCRRELIMNKLRRCQANVHAWGKVNRVEFDPSKEAFNVLHPLNGHGDTFKLLGLMIDVRLNMQEAIQAILKKARPKLQALMRTRAYYNYVDMFLQYKTHVLGLLESNIGGIYHATNTALAPLDRLQTTFVHNFNMNVKEAFVNMNLAPLCLRRDIAMLGFLHKCNLPHAHPDVLQLFPRMRTTGGGIHTKQLWDIMTLDRECQFQPELRRRSLFRLVHVYNALPQRVVDCGTVHDFQHDLTEMARHKLRQEHEDWQTFLSPRTFDDSRGIVGI